MHWKKVLRNVSLANELPQLKRCAHLLEEGAADSQNLRVVRVHTRSNRVKTNTWERGVSSQSHRSQYNIVLHGVPSVSVQHTVLRCGVSRYRVSDTPTQPELTHRSVSAPSQGIAGVCTVAYE